MAAGSIYGYKTYSGHLWQIIAQIKSQKVEISVKVLENGGQVAYCRVARRRRLHVSYGL